MQITLAETPRRMKPREAEVGRWYWIRLRTDEGWALTPYQCRGVGKFGAFSGEVRSHFITDIAELYGPLPEPEKQKELSDG